jgi:hypothetical protein
MGKQQEKKATVTLDRFFVFGMDEKGKPRGARFAQHNDRVVNAALDLNLNAVKVASPAFAEAAKKLPEGRLYASGKAFIPNIKQSLHDELAGILRQTGDTSEAYNATHSPGQPPNGSSDAPVRCVSPITSGLPRSWDAIGVGHMVLAHESPDDGWWEALVIKREEDILTLRYRDAPKLPTFIRHVTTVALVNPGPLAEQA